MFINAKVTSVEVIENPDFVVDIGVADNHNLFVCSEISETPVLAHNCMAGEYLLDENMKANTARVHGRNKTSYGLDWICSSYGCDFYTENEFGKQDRGNIANISLTPDVLRYMVADVQLPWLIMRMQKARAEKQIVNGVPYTQAFMKMMLWQMSNMIHVQSMMEHRGEHLDIEWLQSLLKKDGPLDKVEQKLEGEFRNFESVRKVNESLLALSGVQSTSIFGVSNWVFSVTKPRHKIQLFFDTLGLEPTSIGKSGQPAVDKEFQEKYKDVPEVAAFKTLAQVGKVRSTYVLGFLKKLQTEDMAVDHCLRASYGFFETVTGRSNSYDPNLQNIIQRGDLAKLIKRAFTADYGTLSVKMDFSAHEVRMWGIESQDRILCSLFVNGRWLRRMYRATGKPVYKALMETIGDIHKINVATFFQTAPANATKEQRDQVKSIVFGCFTGDTIVSTNNGPIRIAALAKSGDKPVVITKGGLALKSGGAASRGIKPIVGVLTAHAYLQGTSGHKIAVINKDCTVEMKPLGRLSESDAVLYQVGKIGTNIPAIDGQPLGIANTEALGLFTADGCGNYYNKERCGNYRLSHASIGTTETKKVQGLFTWLCGKVPKIAISKTSRQKQYATCQINNKEAYVKLLKFGLLGNQHERRVPDKILTATSDYIAAYLRGFFEGDGGIRGINTHPQVFATTCNLALASDICYLLNLINIHARIYGPFTRVTNFAGREQQSKTESVEIIITYNKDVVSFINSVGFITKIKKEKAKIALTTIANQTVNREQPFNLNRYIDYSALRAKYCAAAGVSSFRGRKILVGDRPVLPIPRYIHDLVCNIEKFAPSFITLGLHNELDTLRLLSKPGSLISAVRSRPKNIGSALVYDVLNVEKEHTWSANGVIVSNSIYGRSARAISVQIKKAEDVIKELMRKFFSRFKKAAAYLESKKKQAVSKGHTVSLIGRVRHLYIQYLGIDQFVAAAERRGANAPIQGISADLGHTAAYLFEQHFDHVCVKFGLSDNRRTKSGTTSFVHDAIKSAVEYKKMLVATQVLQWCSTVGLCEYYTRLFGVNFLVEPEIEIELGASDDALLKWDWHEDTLKTIIRKSLENQKGIYPQLDVDKAEAVIWSVRNEPIQEYLDKHYPILGEWPKAVHWRKGMKEYDNLQAEIKAWK